MNPREGALKVLHDIEVKKAYSNIALNQELKNNQYSQIDKNFITELTYGTLENLIYIDYIIQQFATTKLHKINAWALNILRIGIYQIFFLDRVPNFAAVNESVNLSKIYCKRASGFVNGILRNTIRNKEKIQMPNKEKDFINFLAVQYSHPQWMVEMFLDIFSKDFTESLLQANNTTPKLHVRINTLKASAEEIITLLKNKNITVEKSQYIHEALIVESGFSGLEEFDIYKKGLIQIQDISSMLVAKILDPKEGQFIIDICSAPGGKATHIAELMKNRGKVLARDIHPHKLQLIKSNAKRLGIEILKVEQYNGKDLDKSLIETADKVLVDAPCSGLGIIRRKPEIKYRKAPEDMKTITKLQLEILEKASRYVKKGGELLYSTCTIHPMENQNVVETFLMKHKNFQLMPINKQYKDFLPGEHNEKMIQLYPNIHGTDGFFIAKIKKN